MASRATGALMAVFIGVFDGRLSAGVMVSVTLASAPNPAVYGQPVTLAATVSPASSSGEVTFYDGVTILGFAAPAGGQATLTTRLLASGKRSLHAYYAGIVSASIVQTVTVRPSSGYRLVLGSATNSATGAAPASVAVGDFNGDGKADMAIANASGGSILVLLGNGDGTFAPAVPYAIGGTPNSIATGDFNGDGHTDLAVTNNMTASILLGIGDGTFQAPAQYTAGMGPQAVAMADFNGDGKADLAVVNSQVFYSTGSGPPIPPNTLSVFLGNGDGTFQTATNISGAGGNAVAIGDFNGDGIADIATAGSGSTCEMFGCSGFPGGLSVLLGNGDGTFQVATALPDAIGNSIAVGDFNADGKMDLAVGATFYDSVLIPSGSINVLLGIGDGTFQPGVTYDSMLGYISSIASGDFNGDGVTDLAVVVGGVTTLYGKGDGTFETVFQSLYPGLASAIAVGSFGGAGRTDIVEANISGANVLLGTTSGVPSVNAVVNAATLEPGPLAGGSIVTLYGTFPVSSAAKAPVTPLPISLAGLSVQAGGVSAPLFSVSSEEVTIQVPWEVTGIFGISVTVNGVTNAGQAADFGDAPGIFTTNSRGTGQGEIFDSGGRLVDATNPATAGSSIVQIYCTGLGAYPGGELNGAAAPSGSLQSLMTYTKPTVTIGGLSARVIYSGATPGAVGLYQVNVLVPAIVLAGSARSAVSVTIAENGVSSNTVTMAVQ